jgi:hypothetical protein
VFENNFKKPAGNSGLFYLKQKYFNFFGRPGGLSLLAFFIALQDNKKELKQAAPSLAHTMPY